MTDDATFEDGREAPLNLGAFDPDDLQVISALTQDAVFPITEMSWQAGQRRFAILLNRFRWEDQGRERHAPERVQSVLVIDNVLRVSSQGVERSEADTILSLLSISFHPGEEGTGHLLLTLAGDGALRLEVEALEVTLKDVTRPYIAPSGKTPDHG
ncbi:DUF2948 family protein [Roseovarius gahaiensis]|uniref:DUF2948 family protein n=1 Tax=Roseovarius gahaiensis TaxID=2716691 RepID=A0A967BE49_9RHOB|nr:DUF2948 family protein [Roseovarius gahaiensis]